MAKIKPLEDDNILSFLQQDSLVSTSNDDPLTQSVLIVTLDQLQPYELNPRRSRNPSYDDIRESIENAGLKRAPNITRRQPGDEKYSIRDGGNTRLVILRELHDKYKYLAEKEPDKKKSQALQQKADSFFRIKCDFIPWHSDLDALSSHMIENEARGGTKFIEKALVVQRYKKLFIEQDKQTAIDENKPFTDKQLSTRKLAERISKTGWIISFSHIAKFNYAANVLINHIPNALWAGAGEPVVKRIQSLYSAYDVFWGATDQGQTNPERIQNLFYDALSIVDDEKLDISGFTQELDMQLEDIISIPCISIMAEINALMNGSNKSLKHEPDALRIKIDEENNKSLDQKYEPGVLPVLPPKQNNKAVAEIQPPSSADKDSQIQATTQPEKTTDHLPALRKLIVTQVKKISDLSPGYIGLMIMDEKNLEQQHYIENNIFFDAVNFFDAELHAYPEFGQPDDDTRTMIWWQLQKFSRDYSISDHGQFDKLMQKALSSYLKAIQSINPEHQLIDVILWLEHKLMQQPELMQECIRLQQMQARLLETISDQKKAMEVAR
jgi:ParB family protein of integrating conjugative element (PFGI_1 class)